LLGSSKYFFECNCEKSHAMLRSSKVLQAHHDLLSVVQAQPLMGF